MEQNRKFIRFPRKTFKILLYCFFSVLLILFVLVQAHSFQTFLGRKLGTYFSKELKTEVRIGRVGIDFFQKAVLKDILVLDLHRDTLLYAEKISCDVSKFVYPFNRLQLDKIEIENANAKVIQYKNENDFNFQFLIDYFASDTSKATETTDFEILFGDLVLNQVDFSFINQNDSLNPKKGINYNNLKLNNTRLVVQDFKIDSDTIHANIRQLQTVEKSGFQLNSFESELKISPRFILLEKVKFATLNSVLHGDIGMYTKSYDDYSDFLQKVELNVLLNENTHFNPADLSYFVSDLEGFDQDIKISGKVKGTVNSLRGKDMYLQYRTNTVFAGDFTIDGLPDPEQTFLHVDIDTLKTCRSDLINIPLPPFSNKKKLAVPDEIDKLGLIQFKGKVDGMLTDIVAFGNLNTDLGKVKIDLGMTKLSDATKAYAYKGNIFLNQFLLGNLTGNKNLGELTMEATINGKGIDLEEIEIKMKGEILKVVYNNYPYKGIEVQGSFEKKLFEGKFDSNDENAKLTFNGSADFNGKIPELDFTADIQKINFWKLNFLSSSSSILTKDSTSVFSSFMKIRMNGDNPDNLSGKIHFDNTNLTYSGVKYSLPFFDLDIQQISIPKNITLRSDVADLYVNGDFSLSTLPNSLEDFLVHYYPTFFDLNKEKTKVTKAPSNNQLEFQLKIKKFDVIKGVFFPTVDIGKNSILEGVFDSRQNFLSCVAKANNIGFNGIKISDWKMKLETKDGIRLQNEFGKLSVSDSLYLQNLVSEIRSLDNKSQFSFNWRNNTPQRNSGDLKGTVDFSVHHADIRFQNFQLFVQDSLWTLKDNNLISADSSGRIVFTDVNFSNNSQLLMIHGAISKLAQDKLFIEVKDFKLKQLNPLLRDAKLSLDGLVSGSNSILLDGDNFIFTSSLDFKNLFINEKIIGSGKINAAYDKSKDAISMNGGLKKEYSVAMQNTFHNLEFAGYYYPSLKENNIDLKLKINSIDIGVLQPFVAGILTFGRGYLSGNINVKGSIDNPLLDGNISLESVKNMKVDYLNTLYRISGNIKIEPDRIAFEQINVFDNPGNSGVLWGNIFHKNFKNLKYDFDLNINKLSCLNTTAAQNSSYYGKAFATGNIGIWNNSDITNIEVNIKTEKGTQFNIPLSGPAEVSDNDFIQFVTNDSSDLKDNQETDLSGLSMLFNLEATPEAEIQLIFDEKAGDVIKAKGNGSLKMLIDTKGKFEMYGPYTITDGSYLFTLENFINKKFDIENGSTIKWSGDPYNAQINISANYKQRASLSPFFPNLQSSSSDNSSAAQAGAGSSSPPTTSAGAGQDVNKRYPVECKLFMKEKLLSPEITFGIGLPTVDDAIRQTVLGYINNEQELNRQVFSLLILKSFVTPLVLSNQSGVSAGNAMGSNATEMLSNQLSNWLSQLTTNIDVGVNYRPGDALSNEELDLALSTQLFNDKLSIDGNLGLNNNAQTNNSNMIGDLNMDYKVTDDGKFRVKGFNRSNDTYLATTQGGQFTQGVGFFYREDFETIAELYRRYTKFVSRKKKLAPKTSNDGKS